MLNDWFQIVNKQLCMKKMSQDYFSHLHSHSINNFTGKTQSKGKRALISPIFRWWRESPRRIHFIIILSQDGESFTSQEQYKFARTKTTRSHLVFSPPPLFPSSLQGYDWPVRRCSLTRGRYQKYTAEKGGKDSRMNESPLTKVEKYCRKTWRKILWVNSLILINYTACPLDSVICVNIPSPTMTFVLIFGISAIFLILQKFCIYP